MAIRYRCGLHIGYIIFPFGRATCKARVQQPATIDFEAVPMNQPVSKPADYAQKNLLFETSILNPV